MINICINKSYESIYLSKLKGKSLMSEVNDKTTYKKLLLFIIILQDSSEYFIEIFRLAKEGMIVSRFIQYRHIMSLNNWFSSL